MIFTMSEQFLDHSWLVPVLSGSLNKFMFAGFRVEGSRAEAIISGWFHF